MSVGYWGCLVWSLFACPMLLLFDSGCYFFTHLASIVASSWDGWWRLKKQIKKHLWATVPLSFLFFSSSYSTAPCLVPSFGDCSLLYFAHTFGCWSISRVELCAVHNELHEFLRTISRHVFHELGNIEGKSKWCGDRQTDREERGEREKREIWGKHNYYYNLYYFFE